jgi:hypothetical protein
MLTHFQQNNIMESYEHDCQILYSEICKNPSVDITTIHGLRHTYESCSSTRTIEVVLADTENELLRIDRSDMEILIWKFVHVM